MRLYGPEIELHETPNTIKYVFYPCFRLPNIEEYKTLIEQAITPLEIKDYKIWIENELIILSVASKSTEKKMPVGIFPAPTKPQINRTKDKKNGKRSSKVRR